MSLKVSYQQALIAALIVVAIPLLSAQAQADARQKEREARDSAPVASRPLPPERVRPSRPVVTPTPQPPVPSRPADDDSISIERAREIERQERDRAESMRQAEREARERREREEARWEHEEQLRREEARQAQEEWDRQERARRQAELDRQEWERQTAAEAERIRLAEQRAELIRQQAELEAQRQALREEQEREARRGIASVRFKNITRKAGGEWLRITLATPMDLHVLQLEVEKAELQIHEAYVVTTAKERIEISDLMDTGVFDGHRDIGVEQFEDRVVAIDMRAESMGAMSTVKVSVKTDNGVPKLKTSKFKYK